MPMWDNKNPTSPTPKQSLKTTVYKSDMIAVLLAFQFALTADETAKGWKIAYWVFIVLILVIPIVDSWRPAFCHNRAQQEDAPGEAFIKSARRHVFGHIAAFLFAMVILVLII